MKNIENKIIWQPIFRPSMFEFEVVLDRDFAMEMVNTKIPAKRQNEMNDLAAELLNLTTNPYQFYQDSCFVSRFNLADSRIGLAEDHSPEYYINKKTSQPIKYYSHNADDPYKSHELMTLFNLWIRYANNLKGLKKIRSN